MSLQIRYNSATEVADTVTVRQGVAFSMAAEEGAVATSTIVVDDTAATLDYIGWRRIYAYETLCQAHNQMVYNGYLAPGAQIGRLPAEGPDSDVEIVGAARRWSISVADTNSLLSRRLITGADGNRPAETDIARIQWLLDSNDAYLSNPMDTWENPSPYINTTGPIDMSAADLRGQTAHDVLNDCAQRSGKLWFAFYYEANDTVPPTNNGSIALFYDWDYSTAYSSTLRISNVAADVDNAVTFAPFPDAELERDWSRCYSGIYLTYDGGTRYQQSTVVENLFQRRDAAVTNTDVKTDAEAEQLCTRYLDDASTRDDRLTFRYICAPQYVNDLREGQRFQAKFTHLPDYSTFRWWRLLRRTVKHLTDGMYEVSGEATPLPCAPDVEQFAWTGQGVGTWGDGLTATFAATPTPGNVIVAGLMGNSISWDNTVWPAGWTLLHRQRINLGTYYPNQSIEVRWHIVEAGDGASLTLTNDQNNGDSWALGMYECACGADVPQTQYWQDHGTTTLVIPSTTTTYNPSSLLLGFHCRTTSAVPRDDPANWTVDAKSWQDLGARQLVAFWSRVVTPGTYSQTFTNGAGGDPPTSGILVVEVIG